MPTTATDVIALTLDVGRQAVHRFAADLTAEELLHRTVPAANCAAWIIGHLTLTDRRVAEAFGADLPPLPTADFEQVFSRDDGRPQAAAFGDTSTLIETFDANRRALIDAVRGASPDVLDAELPKPGPFGVTTVGEMANLMGTHAAIHAGQITMIRRSLGKPVVF